MILSGNFLKILKLNFRNEDNVNNPETIYCFCNHGINRPFFFTGMGTFT